MSKSEIFKTLSQVNVSGLVKKKMGLNYLSWADAWAILMKYYPESKYTFKEFPEYCYCQETKKWESTGRKVDYRKTECGTEVTTILKINDEAYEMSLYVMDNRNRVVKQPDYSQINKTQQRCLVKAIALAGLGLNVYQGEDLPSSENTSKLQPKPQPKKQDSALNKAKAEYQELIEKACDATGRKVADIQQELVKETASISDFLTRYEKMNSMLKDMLKGETQQQTLGGITNE